MSIFGDLPSIRKAACCRSMSDGIRLFDLRTGNEVDLPPSKATTRLLFKEDGALLTTAIAACSAGRFGMSFPPIGGSDRRILLSKSFIDWPQTETSNVIGQATRRTVRW